MNFCLKCSKRQTRIATEAELIYRRIKLFQKTHCLKLNQLVNFFPYEFLQIQQVGTLGLIIE